MRDAKALFSFSHLRNSARLEDERIGALRTAGSTRGSGLFGFGTVAEQLARFLPSARQERTEEAKGSAIPQPTPNTSVPARIGLGLPMSNIYATYFGLFNSILRVRTMQLIMVPLRWFIGSDVSRWMG